ncbi:MAG TPA: decarboxylating NADP(+)-dependent phosphogluconate dehydrogenase [Polyangia bacterium]|nr:decarboxylating NADP(+)-dependent phosphogluconate dehydrogenase [Polyangia bacterium]
MAKPQASFGVIGLGVMGQNLALNIEEHGYPIAVWNLEPEGVDRFVAKNPSIRVTPAKRLEEFVAALERPRRILMMIKAGAPVDEMLEKLRPLLEAGDIVIDGGNSWFKDTQRREAALKLSGAFFFGAGVSGGEEGARRGPCLMPGGAKQAYEPVKPIFEAIAAKTDSGPCVTWCGPDGAGHFVKMVHNGIEYGDMQLIAEAYDLMRKAGGMSAKEMSAQFAAWNRGRLESFLIELTAEVLTVEDERGGALVDRVLDAAQQKGTGKWTAQVALDLGVPIPTIAAAIDARVVSSLTAMRAEAREKLGGAPANAARIDREELVAAVEEALYASKICSYAQGMHLIRAGSDEYKWGVDLAELGRIWKGGCIIRARFLDDIRVAFQRRPQLANLLFDEKFAPEVRAAEPGWRKAVSLAHARGIPVPSMGASLSYFDALRADRLPQNLTQAQRDAFGAHTYVRADRPEAGALHTEWLKKAKL